MIRIGPIVLLAVACTTRTVAAVSEPHDVPPPPGARTLDLGPVEHAPHQPGAILRIDGAPAEVVDRRTTERGVVLTVYVDEATADRLLARGSVVIEGRSGCTPRSIR